MWKGIDCQDASYVPMSVAMVYRDLSNVTEAERMYLIQMRSPQDQLRNIVTELMYRKNAESAFLFYNGSAVGK
jgi:hypothetical protein